jgi:hypothetical protein
MPLQNRVDPFGNLFADRSRGLFLGNRGGRFHRDDRTLASRRFASRRWICCVLEFKGRRRKVWAEGYTELFFLDEPTALSAGHRPCFECRRADAETFADCWSRARALNLTARADQMDAVLHAERTGEKRGQLNIDDLPDGAFVVLHDDPGAAFAVSGNRLLRWSPAGYSADRRRPRGLMVEVLTPPSIVAALVFGYRPAWHPTALTPHRLIGT